MRRHLLSPEVILNGAVAAVANRQDKLRTILILFDMNVAADISFVIAFLETARIRPVAPRLSQPVVLPRIARWTLPRSPYDVPHCSLCVILHLQYKPLLLQVVVVDVIFGQHTEPLLKKGAVPRDRAVAAAALPT